MDLILKFIIPTVQIVRTLIYKGLDPEHSLDFNKYIKCQYGMSLSSIIP